MSDNSKSKPIAETDDAKSVIIEDEIDGTEATTSDTVPAKELTHSEKPQDDMKGLSYTEKSLKDWTVEDVRDWAASETALPRNVVEELVEHRFHGPMLAQLTSKRLEGFGASPEDAEHAEKAIENLLTTKAEEDPLEDVQELATLTRLRRGWKSRKASVTETPPIRTEEDEKLEKESDHTPGRERRWGNPIEFALALVSYAVGLGNIWRFPYLAYSNGGGAFLIVYLIFLIFLGIPMFVMELGLGQLFQVGAVQLWGTISPRLSGLGLSSIVVAGVVSVYYNVIIAWALFYLIQSFRSPLPFRDNTEAYWFDTALEVTNNANGITDGVVWHLFGTLAFAWALVFLIIFRGARSTGKTTYFTAIFPYVVLIILLVRAVTLDNASEGIIHFFSPDFSELLNFQVWIAAATQIFYSLGIGWGALIAFASFNSKKHNFMRDAYAVSIINALTSFLAGITVFAAVGFLAGKTGQSVSDVAASGSGLAFVVFPQILVEFPVSQFFSVMFFLMIATLGIGSEFSMVIAVRNGIMQSPSLKWFTHRFSPVTISVMLCVVMFGAGIIFVTRAGFYLVNLIDQTAAAITLVVVVLVELYAMLFIYGRGKFVDQCAAMTGKRIPKVIQWAWITTCPVLLCVIVIGVLVQYPQGDYEQLGCLGGVTEGDDCPDVSWFTAVAYVVSFASLLPAAGLFLKHWKTPRPQLKAAVAIEQQREDRMMQMEKAKTHRYDEPGNKVQEKLHAREHKINDILSKRRDQTQEASQEGH